MLVRLHNSVAVSVQRITEDWLIATLARLVFAGVFLIYFLNSVRTKLGEGLAGLVDLDDGAYVQILPREMEAVGYDPAALTGLEQATVYAGTFGELILPVLIVAGLFTRIAAVGMIVFVAVMTYTDIAAHGASAETIGAWFDNLAGSAIADQRALWGFLLLVLALKGPGPLSLDALLGRLWVAR
ncbi:DoxX family protein [Acuticoccus sp.]|uniref:DoxX family protein n=1 Tax=Acuticoccus sp. TaxID=1904378 RepID=UPI003B518771